MTIVLSSVARKRLSVYFILRKMQCPTRNNFCYVCGLFAPSKNFKNITKTVVNSFQKIFKTAYVPYLWYTPEVVCDYCYRNLCKFTDGRSTIKYSVPTIWLPRTEHCSELCYFCVTFTQTKGYQYFRRNKIRYANVESVIPAVLYSPEERIAASMEIFDDVPELRDGEPTVAPTMLSTFLASNARCGEPEVSEFVPTPSELGTAVPHLVTQADFNDLVREGNLSKRTAELFASRFKQWNIVAADFKITAARDRRSSIPYDEFFKLHEDREKNLAYCCDIDSMFEKIGYPHISEEWRLFIDASVNSLKVVLLHIGNKHPAVPIAYATNLKETYEGMELILQLINYQEHNWKICCDLKVVGLLMGVKRVFPTHQCFLCTWEGRKRDQHYTEFKWKPRTCYKVGVESIENLPLVQPSQIILPSLHIKLGVVSNFVKKLDREGEAIASLRNIFPKLSGAKIHAGIFFYEGF